MSITLHEAYLVEGCLCFPVGSPSGGRIVGVPLPAELLGVDRPSALICPHDSESVSLLRNLLSNWGYEVSYAATHAETAAILRQDRPPKIVIMDMSMENIELCRGLRAESRDYYPYVLMTGGRNNKAVDELALHSGADDFLPRPLDALGVLARLTVARRILDLQDRLILAREELRVRATKDSLTGLFNRATFNDLFQRELDRAGRSRSHTGLLMLDLDHFKKINDAYGHSAGDEALREVSRRLKNTVRSYDFVGRYGGEEFCAVLSNCPERDLRERAEAIRLAIWRDPVSVGGAAVRLTASIGATVVFANAWSAADAIEVADVALYHAKNSGRNCTVCCRRRKPEKSSKAEPIKGLCAACDPQYSKKCLMRVQAAQPASANQNSSGSLRVIGTSAL